MDEELKDKLYKILSDLPSENSCVDYKIIPYKETHHEKAEFIKDLSGFLNSIEGFDKDKFIILGVEEKNNQYTRLGLKNNTMNDDCFYQDLAKNISPRPSIETGKIKYPAASEDYYGYIYIPAHLNKDRIYEINNHVPNEGKYVDDIYKKIQSAPVVVEEFQNYISELRNMIKGNRVYASTAWIRRGSITEIMTESDRRKIYEAVHGENADYKIPTLKSYDLSKIDSGNALLKMIVLLGAWDETNDNDKQVVSELIGQPYDTLINGVRLMLNDVNIPIIYKNEKWQLENRIDLLKTLASSYFKDDILAFQSKSIEVLSQQNPKFNLPSDQRWISSSTQTKPKYSELLRKSIAETLAMITSMSENFINSADSTKYLSHHVIVDVLKNVDWKLLASLDCVMPLLAESNPDLFLKMLEDIKLEQPDVIKEFVTSSEKSITDNYYTTGLYWALQLIAWEETYLSRVCVLLSQFSKYDKKADDTIIGILLPWFPQTKASNDFRKTAVENIIKENEECGWKVIIELMPNKRTIGTFSYKPKWNNLISEDRENKVSHKDYWSQVKNYLSILIKYSKTNINKLCDLIDLLDDIPENMRKMVESKLSQKSIKELPEEKRYILWNHLETFINRHIKFEDTKWALSKEILMEIQKISNELKPSDKLLYNKRYFIRDSWSLYDEKGDYKKSEADLHNLRVKIIKEIYNIGIESIIIFVNRVEDSYVVGICLAEIITEILDEKKVLAYLDSQKENEVAFAKGFVYKKYSINGESWLDRFDIYSWNDEKIVNFLIMLPKTSTTWALVSKYLKDNELKYWKTVDIRMLENDTDINYSMKKLIDANRPKEAISILDTSTNREKVIDYDRKLAVKALNDILSNQDNLNSSDYYHIGEVIKDLQNSNVSTEDLFKIEWAYLNLLSGSYGDGRPITIEKEMAINPEKFNEILSLVYKEHSIPKEEFNFVDEKIATNAYRLLSQWRIVPGTTSNNKINKARLNDWYKKMVKICSESDRLEVGLMNFGHVLYYAPTNKNGVLNKSVAEIMNEDSINASILRDSYRTEAFNSLGVISLDKGGTVYDNLAEKYEKQAISNEQAGYSRIATIFRSLAKSYRNQAEETRKRYDDFD